jgi:hypothetical protein
MLLIRDVAGDEHDVAAGLLDPARGLAGVVFLLRQVGDQNIGTFAGERDGDRPADSGVPAGDYRGAALELATAFVRLLAMVGPGRHLGRVAGRLLLLLGLRRRRAGVPGVLGHGWAAPRGLVLAEQRGRGRVVPASHDGSGAAREFENEELRSEILVFAEALRRRCAATAAFPGR